MTILHPLTAPSILPTSTCLARASLLHLHLHDCKSAASIPPLRLLYSISTTLPLSPPSISQASPSRSPSIIKHPPGKLAASHLLQHPPFCKRHPLFEHVSTCSVILHQILNSFEMSYNNGPMPQVRRLHSIKLLSFARAIKFQKSRANSIAELPATTISPGRTNWTCFTYAQRSYTRRAPPKPRCCQGIHSGFVCS